MALYPLCRHRRSRRDAVAHAAGAITNRVADSVARADLLTTLAIFGRLVGPEAEVVRIIGRQHMKESPLYQEIMEEGAVNARRADIRTVLEERFGAEAAAQFAEAVGAIDDIEELARLLRVAAGCRHVSEFRRGLRSRRPRR